MKYNFDQEIDRWNSGSVKYDGPKKLLKGKPYIPMWVADMDFKTPQPILNTIQKQLNIGVLGYNFIPEDWYESIINWCRTRYQWQVEQEEIIYTPGVVRGLAFTINSFSTVGDKIMVMSPVYPPFFNVSKTNRREVVYHRLELVDNQFMIDFNQFEQDLLGCKLLILCNPHNPGGRVWSKEELTKIADICHKHSVLVVSDEIHADLTLQNKQHNPFPTVSTTANDNSIVFMAPSKAFNMPGIACSYVIIKNKELREQYKSFVEALDVMSGNMFAYNALIAAYNECSDWLEEVKSYIESNIDFVDQFLKQMPLIKMIRPQASYLIFLDFRLLNLSDKELQEFLIDKAGLLLNPGESFGPGGAGFMRLNVGCSKKVLERALNQLYLAYINCY